MIYIVVGVGIFIFLAMIWEYINSKDKIVYLVKNSIILLIILLILFLFGPFFILSPIKIGHSTIEENGITLIYPNDKNEQVLQIMKLCQETSYANDKFFQTKTTPKILLISSDFDMLRFGANPKAAGAGLPWGINIKISKANYNIIAHELTHLTLQTLTGKSALSFPRWFDEGLASYLGKMDYYRSLDELRSDIYAGSYQENITSWRGLRGLLAWQNIIFFDPHRNPHLVYGQSYQMVKYLVEQYGQEKISLLLTLTKSMPFDQSFKKTYDLSEKDFADEFLNFLQK